MDKSFRCLHLSDTDSNADVDANRYADCHTNEDSTTVFDASADRHTNRYSNTDDDHDRNACQLADTVSISNADDDADDDDDGYALEHAYADADTDRYTNHQFDTRADAGDVYAHLDLRRQYWICHNVGLYRLQRAVAAHH